jgi:hypothetical protein
MSLRLLLGLVLLPLGCGGGTDAPGASAEADTDPFTRERGELATGDQTLTSGEFSDSYTFDVQPGQWVEVALTSSTFDPYVILKPPSCADVQGTCDRQTDNDDFLPGGGSFLWERADEAGRWEVLVTSFQPGETGAYELAYRVADAGQQPETAGVLLGAGRTERGRLESNDPTLSSGELNDSYGFVGRAGERVTFDLRSSEFDPYLILQMPDDHPQADNDDWEGAQDHARIETTLPADGQYRVLVTTFRPGEQGAYELQMAAGAAGAEGAAEGGTAPIGTGKPPAGGSSPPASDPFQKQ